MNHTITMTRRKYSARTITVTALLSTIAYILAFVEFPVPLSPPFARMDFSDFPALIGAFAFGPLAGVLIELVKNALQLFSTSTGGIGELANFLMGASFVFTAGLIYGCHKTKKTAWIARIIGSIVMGIVAAVANYFILLPLFEQFMREAEEAKVDAVIVADLGLMSLVKKFTPDMEIHMSTQTGIVNYASANELYNMGAKRVVLARELSLEEI